MTVNLNLWISNQPDGAGGDVTSDYIEAAHWTPPTGVQWADSACTLSGAAEDAWAAYRSLAAAVAAVGHGLEDVAAEEELGDPQLTACPEQLICEGWTCAAESLARLESTERATWAEFAASVPSMKAEADCGR